MLQQQLSDGASASEKHVTSMRWLTSAESRGVNSPLEVAPRTPGHRMHLPSLARQKERLRRKIPWFASVFSDRRRGAMMIRCLSLLAVLAVVAAQRPEVCNSPDQWGANMMMFDPYEGHQFAVRAKYYYDKTGLRKARVEEVDGRNTTHRYVQVIELFAEHYRYDIDLETKECVQTPLNRPGVLDGFHAHDVPAGASFRSLFYIGSDAVTGGSVEGSAWDYMYTDLGYYWHGTFTTHGCFPLRSDEFDSKSFIGRFEEFSDITPGISDPNVFIPPSNCRPGKFMH